MKKVSPLVSIIIPTYNAENYISETIRSIENQNYTNWELIIIDDGSKDSTKKLISKFALIDKRIKYFYQNNQGSPIAKNLGLSIAKGDYIQFLDADDIISYDKIFEQVLELENNPGHVAVCDTFIFEKNDDITKSNLIGPIDKEFVYTTSDTLDFVLNLNGCKGNQGMIQPNAFLTPTEIIKEAGNWSTLLARSPDDDSEFFLRVLLKSKGVIHCTKGSNYYRRIKSDSLSKAKSYENIRGAFLTVKLKFEQILLVKNNEQIVLLYFKSLTSFLYKYSRYFDIAYPLVKEEMNNYGIKKLPVPGGKNFARLSKILGVVNSFRLINLIRYGKF